MASAGARAYNGGLGAEPPAGSRGRAPGQGVRERSPPEAENLLASRCATEAANLPHSPQFANFLLQFNNSYKRDTVKQHWRRKQFESAGAHAERGARAYNGGLGAEPPAGSRGRAPGQGVREAKPPEAESILIIGCPTEPANLAPF